MAKILLDYFMPVTTLESTPNASTGFLKQVCVVAKPKSGQEGNVGTIFPCTSAAQVAVRTDNTNCDQLFAAGMSKVFLLLSDDLEIDEALLTEAGEFYTVLISDDFDEEDLNGDVTVPAVAASIKIQDLTFTAKTAGAAGNSITITYDDSKSDGSAEVTDVTGSAITIAIEAGVTTAETIAQAVEDSAGSGDDADALVSVAVDVGDEEDPQTDDGVTAVALEDGADETTTAGDIDVGEFDGVVGFASSDAEVCQLFGARDKRAAFFTSDTNGAKNMFYAFGKLLANQSNWLNNQYISMPYNDGVEALGDANSLFDDKVNFVIHDDEFGNRLALFVAGGKAIVAPYIKKNLSIDLQSRALNWISANQPQYTITDATLLEQRLQDDVIVKKYIANQWIEAGVVNVRLLESNFVANAEINITEPTALWRVFAELQATL